MPDHAIFQQVRSNTCEEPNYEVCNLAEQLLLFKEFKMRFEPTEVGVSYSRSTTLNVRRSQTAHSECI